MRSHHLPLLVSFGPTLWTTMLVGLGLPAQSPQVWMRPHQGPTGSALVHDETRQRTLMFGDRTWEWDGTGWHDIGPGPGVHLGPLVDDVARQQIVSYQPRATRLWDGSTWTLASTTSGPSAKGGALAYDRLRQRVVLFGGRTDVAPWPTDTWEWDGTSWTQRANAGPPARILHAMGYCTVRQRVVLFGGLTATYSELDDMWEWDGSQWTQPAPTNRPVARSGHAMASDPIRGRILLIGGEDVNRYPLEDSWIWNGTTWIQEPSSPGGRVWHVAAFDRARDRMIVFGGSFEGSACSYCVYWADTWEHDGVSWRIANPGRFPGWGFWSTGRTNVVYDSARRRVMRIARSTSIWDGRRWRALHPVVEPDVTDGSLADDAVRGRVVLFGRAVNGGQAETWEWDGVSWVQVPTTAGPTPRGGAGMVFDAARQRIVLFGGLDQNRSPLADTWTWDGVSWVRSSPSTSPPARFRHAMAYDATLQRVVLFGGSVGGFGQPALSDTWHFDGTTWTQQVPITSPGPQVPPSMDYDRARNRTVLIGNGGSVWEWDGATWSQQLPGGINLGPAESQQAAYDVERRHIVLHTGYETFLLGDVHPARVTTLGLGCPGSNGMPSLRTDLPLLGNPEFSLDLVTAAANSMALFALDVATRPQSLGGGCSLYVPANPVALWLAQTDAAGSAAWRVPIPADLALRGQVFYVQAVAFDAGGAGGGFTTTAARRIMLGH